MLGRLRMTVDDCIQEYKKLGDDVFGRPQMFSTRYYLLGDRPLYDSKRFENTLKNFVNRRRERYQGFLPETLLASDRDLCRM